MATAAETRPDPYAAAKQVLSQIPHPVVIIGAAHGDERSCATATTMYVSHVPPMLAIAEHPGSRTTRLLHDAQQELAVQAGHSAPGADKFAALKIPIVTQSFTKVPAVAGSIAQMWCKVRDTRPTGDHVLFVGEVVAATVNDRKFDALLRYRRRYMRMGHWTSEEAPEGYPT